MNFLLFLEEEEETEKAFPKVSRYLINSYLIFPHIDQKAAQNEVLRKFPEVISWVASFLQRYSYIFGPIIFVKLVSDFNLNIFIIWPITISDFLTEHARLFYIVGNIYIHFGIILFVFLIDKG